MYKIIHAGLLTSLAFSFLPVMQLVNPQLVNAEPSIAMLRKINNPILPVEHLVNINRLSPKARIAAKNVAQWSNSMDMLWIAIYREDNENYVFFARDKQFLIFRTNAEKGGEYTIPKGKIFAVNDTMLETIIAKQDFNGKYKFISKTNGNYSENYITPLVEVDKNGFELPNQSKEPYWALHSPPYTTRRPSEDLSKSGNSCIRLKVSVARFFQNTVAKEILIHENTEFNAYLVRYDTSEYQ